MTFYTFLVKRFQYWSNLFWIKYDFRDNKSYLIWKRDSNCEGRQSSIHLRQVEQDGITFREEWQSVTLLVANLTTEKTIVEGPWMIYRLLYIIKNYTQIEKLFNQFYINMCLIIIIHFSILGTHSIIYSILLIGMVSIIMLELHGVEM